MNRCSDVLVTGLGLLSPYGEDFSEVFDRSHDCEPVDGADAVSIPIVEYQIERQVKERRTRRMMGPMMASAAYAAGKALDSSGLRDEAGILKKADLVVACGPGERLPKFDDKIAERVMTRHSEKDLALNRALVDVLKPTHFLTQLPNLAAANIAMEFGLTGTSRTFVGEDSAGVAALSTAIRRIAAGFSNVALIGAAANSECDYRKVGLSEAGFFSGANNGLLLAENLETYRFGSCAVFLVLESRRHAEARHARAFGRIVCGNDDDGSGNLEVSRLIEAVAGSGKATFSGSIGVSDRWHVEEETLSSLGMSPSCTPTWLYANKFGHTSEANFILGVALACATLDRGVLPNVFGNQGDVASQCDSAVVTNWGLFGDGTLAFVQRYQ